MEIIRSGASCLYNIQTKQGFFRTDYHNHEHANQHEVIFALSGLGILKTDDKEEEIQEGDIMYFSPNENHQIESLDASIVIACIHINAI